jgi:hypothetical protein
MGLCVCVGFAADLKENDSEGYENFKALMTKVNQALNAEGLPPHHEPDSVSPADFLSLDMFGYSGLHYLRRVAAHITFTRKLPSPGDDDSSKDPLVERYYTESLEEKAPKGLLSLFKKSPKIKNFDFNHLMHHSDCEGYYLPLEFTRVLFPDPKLEIPGAMIGSAHRLLQECQRLAAALAIPRDMDSESDELLEAAQNQGEGEGWRRYGVESFTCVRLIHACEASIRSGAALVYA